MTQPAPQPTLITYEPIDVVLTVPSTRHRFYRSPGALAWRLNDLHDPFVPRIRSVMVIDHSTGLTSTWRDEES